MTDGKRFHIVTLGCSKNVVDSEAMTSQLIDSGHSAAFGPQDADVVIVHTCGFIESAKQESVDAILRVAADKRGDQRVIATGCLVERYPDELAAEIPELDALLGARNWSAIGEVVARLYETPGERQPGSSLGLVRLAADGWLDLKMPARRVLGPSAYVKISDGCDQKCAFCAIPRMKGLHRSKHRDLIFTEVEQLLEQGVKEVVLVGQDTTRYGHDLGEHDGLATLLAAMCRRFAELPWIRVMYAYPRHITAALLGVMREESQVCSYLDVPLQHLHPETLRRMRRPHREVEELVQWIREQVPGIALRTTFIVGFPGETEQEFEYLLSTMERLKLDRIGVFEYSDEDGTPAHAFGEHVAPRVRMRRRNRAMALARKLSLQRNRELLGVELNVLIEGSSGEGVDAVAVGRSFRDAPEVDGVVLVSGVHPVGAMVQARVQRALEYDVLATPIPEHASSVHGSATGPRPNTRE